MSLYRLLLRLLPRSFRAEYGAEMCESVAEHWQAVRHRRSALGVARFWWRQTVSVVRVAVALRLTRDRGPELLRVWRIEQPEDRGGGEVLDQLWQDIRYGVRGLRKRPGFAIVAITTLGVGIGATTAIFSAVHSVLFRGLPYDDPDRIVTIFHTDAEGGRLGEGVSAANLIDLRETAERLEHVALAEPWGLDLELEGRAENLRTWAVSEGFFEALGAAPMLGRAFAPDEYVDGNDRVILLGYRSWADRFGADHGILGRTLVMEGETYSVVGVLPPMFKFPDEAEVWMPRADRPRDPRSRAADYMVGVARLPAGTSLDVAQAEVDRVAASLTEAYPDVNEGLGLRLLPLREHLFGDVRTPLLVLLGAVGFVLLIACANVAGLMLARGRQREREYALRGALGADAARIARQITVESLLLAAVGCVLGLGLALAGVRVIHSLGPEHLPRIEELQIDGTVLAFAVCATVLSAVVAALAPSLKMSRPELRAALSEGAHGSTSGRRANAARSRLVVGEVAMAVVLTIGAGLLTKSFFRLVNKDLGFDPDGRFVVQVFAYGYEGSGRVDFVNDAVREIEGLPGVEEVAITTSVPGATDGRIAGIEIDVPYTVVDRARPAAGQEPIGSVIQVTRSYFDVLGIPVLDGREFDLTDNVQAPPVVVINETLARRHFEEGEAVGERLAVLFGDSVPTTREIVGVVQDVRPWGHESDVRAELYVPLSQVGSGDLTFVVHAPRNEAALINPAREAIWAANPRQAIWGAATLDDLLADRLKERRFNLYLLSSFAVIALLLAAVGVYGLMSFSVERRLGELGVRRALGGQPKDIVGMVVREGAVLALTGIAIGIGGALLLTRFLQGMLLEVTPTDPVTFATLTVLVLFVAVTAALLPALRAVRVDPVRVLRVE